jgi:hypothetical protein
MHTYCYAINDNVAAKHVFTSNRRNLQTEADILFREIQLHVQLIRQAKGPGILVHKDSSREINYAMQAISRISLGRGMVLAQTRLGGKKPTVACAKDGT